MRIERSRKWPRSARGGNGKMRKDEGGMQDDWTRKRKQRTRSTER